MNREQLETLVVEATGRSDKTTLIRSALNLAIQRVSAHRLWSDLMTEDEVSIAAGAASVALASDVARVIEARILGAQRRPLMVRPKAWLMQREPDPSQRAATAPCYAYLQGTSLYVIPYPDAEYDIGYTYYKLPAQMTLSTDEQPIRCADAAIAAYATHWVFKSIEKHEDAEMWAQTYLDQLRSAEKVDKSNSVVVHQADQHQDRGQFPGEYWNDPFVLRNP